MTAKSAADWYVKREDWVFKPVSGHGSRGVYVGKSISRKKLAELPAVDYVAQRYAPHPLIDRDGHAWKYDVRFFADRGSGIGAAARVFQGQVVGMRGAGSRSCARTATTAAWLCVGFSARTELCPRPNAVASVSEHATHEGTDSPAMSM